MPRPSGDTNRVTNAIERVLAETLPHTIVEASRIRIANLIRERLDNLLDSGVTSEEFLYELSKQ